MKSELALERHKKRANRHPVIEVWASWHPVVNTLSPPKNPHTTMPETATTATGPQTRSRG